MAREKRIRQTTAWRRLPVTLDDVEAARSACAARSSRPTATSAARCRTSWAARSGSSSRTCSSRPRSRSAARSTGCPPCRPEERKRGVIAMSAGNHAQGVAYHAQPPVDPGHHRHAGQHADGEGGQHAPARRRGDPARRDRGGGGRLRAQARQGARPHLHPSLRRSAGDRRPGHDRAGDAGRRARDRHAGGADRRRRPDLGHGHRRQGAEARPAGDRRAGGALSVDVQRDQGREPADARRHAGRGHRRQGAGPDHAADRAATGRRHPAGVGAADRERREPAHQHREDGGGRRRRGRPGGRVRQSRPLQGPHRRPRAVRRQHRHAAAGERADARAGPRGPPEPARHRPRRPAGPARAGSPTCWARPAPISSRSITSACSPTCRPRARCWRW